MPTDSGAKTALARDIIASTEKHAPLLLIVEEHEVWPSSGNEYLFYRARDGAGAGPPLEDARAHLFVRDEKELCEALLALGLYFVWSVALYDPVGSWIVRTDDEEGITLFLRRGQPQDLAKEVTEAIGLQCLLVRELPN